MMDFSLAGLVYMRESVSEVLIAAIIISSGELLLILKFIDQSL